MRETIFRGIKNEIRILGIDDSPFNKFKDKKTSLIGVVYRGGTYLEGVLRTDISIDGDDSTESIIEMVQNTRHKGHLRVIMLSGITFGGLNIADILKIHAETELPIIVVTRKFPDLGAMKKAIANVKNSKDKIMRLINAGELFEVSIKKKKIVIQIVGVSFKDAVDILRRSIVRGLIPEPLRVAHIIASGTTKGDSKGRA